MKEKIEKSLKHFFKRKITLNLITIVSFLINGNLSYGNEESLEKNYINDGIVYETVNVNSKNWNNNGSIILTNNGNIAEGTEFVYRTGVVIRENEAEIQNNGIVRMYGENENLGENHIISTEDGIKITNFNNTGYITGYMGQAKDNTLIGINVKTDHIKNTGNIFVYGNEGERIFLRGISGSGELTNEGIIFSKYENQLGLGKSIGILGSYKNLNNEGGIYSIGNGSNSTSNYSYGIDTDYSEYILNTGTIKSLLQGSTFYGESFGIISNGKIDNIRNLGIVKAEILGGKGIVNGIKLGYELSNDIQNFGVISAKKENQNGSDDNFYGTSKINGIYTIKSQKLENSGYIETIMNNQNEDGTVVTTIDNFTYINDLSNNGMISASVENSKISKVAGINTLYVLNKSEGKIGELANSGIISAYVDKNSDNEETRIAAILDGEITTLENNGVIRSSHSAIDINKTNSIVNNGLLIGRDGKIVQYDNEDGKYVNNGMEITIDENGNVTGVKTNDKITQTQDGKEIINVKPQTNENDSFMESTGKYNNTIINGVGTEKGVLVVNKDTTLDNVTINAYNSAISLENNNKLTATNTIFNGGGLRGDIATIKGDDGNNILDISQNSIINGDVDLGNGNNSFSLSNQSIGNGNIKFGSGDDNFVLSNESIINGDIILGEGNDIVTLEKNSIVNGNIDLGEGNDNITITDRVTVNGDINLGDGDDILSFDNTVQINGELSGGEGSDILNLGINSSSKEENSGNIRIQYNISGFENLNTNGNVTIYETVKVSDAENINIQNGDLTLRIDPTKKNEDGKIIGHAFYENIGTISSSGGNLVLGLNGLGEDTIIDMGQTTLNPDIDSDWWSEDDHLKTNSLILDAELQENGDVKIIVQDMFEIIPPNLKIDSILYEKLDKVYKSIWSAGELGKLAGTTLLEGKTEEESLKGLLSLLGQIYMNNPYSYTLKSSKDSIKTFEDNLTNLTIKPKKDEYIVQGKAIYTGEKADNEYVGRNYYGFDTGRGNQKIKTNLAGGLATFEYGLTDKTSVGFAFGGNTQSTNFKGSSKIDGNSAYVGAFSKTDLNDFRITVGGGYQYTSADVTRGVSNGYDSFSTNANYNVNTFNTFVEAKVFSKEENSWKVEPKARLSYYYVLQGDINEGYSSNQLTIKTDRGDSSTLDAEIGVDFSKNIYVEDFKLNHILSVGVTGTYGDKSNSLKGYVLGNGKVGSQFDIDSPEHSTLTLKANYNLEMETPKGYIYTAGVGIEEDNLSATLGFGYRF